MKRIASALAAAALLLAASGCGQDAEYTKRQEQNKQAQTKQTLEKANLAKKLQLEEDANRIGYVYIVTFGKPTGYYTIKGKISSSGSQLDPEDLVNCGYARIDGASDQHYCEVIDGPQDDGTYGTGDPGIFFFTTEGTMVVTSLDYLYSTQPLPTTLDIPKLG